MVHDINNKTEYVLHNISHSDGSWNLEAVNIKILFHSNSQGSVTTYNFIIYTNFSPLGENIFVKTLFFENENSWRNGG